MFARVHLTLLVSVMKGKLGADDPEASKQVKQFGAFAESVSAAARSWLYGCFPGEGPGHCSLLGAVALKLRHKGLETGAQPCARPPSQGLLGSEIWKHLLSPKLGVDFPPLLMKGGYRFSSLHKPSVVLP